MNAAEIILTASLVTLIMMLTFAITIISYVMGFVFKTVRRALPMKTTTKK